MYVLGIDASLNGCGYAVIHRDKMIVLECGVIIPKKETKHDLTDGIKLSLIRAKMNYLMVKYPLERNVFIEQGFTRFNKATQALYKARGVIECELWGYKLIDIAPTSIKKVVTGKGNAEKEEVEAKIKEIFNIKEVQTHDVSDAIAVAYTGIIGGY